MSGSILMVLAGSIWLVFVVHIFIQFRWQKAQHAVLMNMLDHLAEQTALLRDILGEVEDMDEPDPVDQELQDYPDEGVIPGVQSYYGKKH